MLFFYGIFDNDVSLSLKVLQQVLQAQFSQSRQEKSQQEQAAFRSSLTNTRLTGLTLLHVHVHRDIPIGLETAIDMLVRT